MVADPLNELNLLKKDILDKKIKDPIQVQNRCRQIWQMLEKEENESVLNQAVSSLDNLVANAKINPYFRAIFATTAGAMVETGKADGMTIYENTLSLFMTALQRGQEILKVKIKTKDYSSKLDKNLQKMYKDATLAWAVLDIVSEPMKSILIMSKEARDAIKKHEHYSEILNFIISYKNYHQGCYHVYTLINIMDGDMLVFHPRSFRGFKIHVTDMLDPMILSYLCTKDLVGTPDEGLIPTTGKAGTTQFALFNWKLISDLYKEGTEPGSSTWTKTGEDLTKNQEAYIESGSTMNEVLAFNNEIPILFLVDYKTPFDFEIHELGKLKPEMELIEILDRKEVENWFSKMKS